MPARPCRLARVTLALSSAMSLAMSLAVLSHDAGAQSAKASGLRRTLDSLWAAHHGVVGYSITNLDTGEHLEQRGNETFSTASLIKVPILVTLFDLAAQKLLTLDDPIVLTEIDKVGGAGQLQYLRTPLTLLAGRGDRWVPLPALRRAAARLPTATLVDVPGGHLLPEERPDEVLARIEGP